MTAVIAQPSGGSGAGVLLLSNGSLRYALGDIAAGTYLVYQDVITFGLQSRTVYDLGEGVLTRGCIAASSYANGYLRKRYALPLAGWGLDLVEQLAVIVGYRSLSGVRGFNPEGGGANSEYKDRYREALKWLAMVRDYEVDPDITEGTPITMTPRVESDCERGW